MKNAPKPTKIKNYVIFLKVWGNFICLIIYVCKIFETFRKNSIRTPEIKKKKKCQPLSIRIYEKNGKKGSAKAKKDLIEKKITRRTTGANKFKQF